MGRNEARDISEQVKAFSEELRQSDGRLRALRDTGEVDPEMFRSALNELRAHYEELLIADDELRAQIEQLDALATSREVEHARYRELFDFAPDPYIVTNVWGLILELNRASEELLGVRPGALRGKPLATLVAHDDASRFRDALAMTTRSERVELDIELRPRGARQNVNVTLVGATSKSEARILWTARPHARLRPDTDAAKMYESSPEAQISALTRALAERDEALAFERRRRQELEQVHADDDDLLAVLSHDLRTPMNAVLGWTRLLRKDALDEKARQRALATIERNTLAQASLVAELLDVSRLKNDKMALDLRPQDLQALGHRAIEAAKPEADAKGVTMSLEVGPGNTVLMADRARLDHVMGYLLSRAIKATPPRGEVRLRFMRRDHWIDLIIEDGRAAEPAALFPATEVTGPAFVAKQLIDLHGAKTNVTEGAVTLSFPARGGRAVNEEDTLARTEELEGKIVLLVEDDADTRALLLTVLAKHGAEVIVVNDAVGAIDACSRSAPALIVSDIGLPEMDGYALITRLRQLGCDVPAVALTAYAAPQDAERAILAGFDAHIAKPVDPYAVVAAAAAVLGSRRDLG